MDKLVLRCLVPQIARETLINALVRFTLLESSRHMKDKNVRCVKVLLCLALTDGNLLRESWGLVLRCISQLSRYGFHLMGSVWRREGLLYRKCFHGYRLTYYCGFDVVHRLLCDILFCT